jgi:hypothetical protein
LRSTKKTPVTKTEFQCEFCSRYFQKEQTLYNHLCENKRRWQDKDLPGNRIGFQSWVEFYKKNTAAKKPKSYIDFTKSAYYIAFVKFGHYCVNIKCINVNRYADWLLKNNIKIDGWCSDTNYEKFLVQHLKDEDPFDAVARSIETTIDHAKKESIQSKDYLRYGNRNRICHLITNGKISPWMLYHSESGVEFLGNIDEGQQKIIMDYINPEQWAIKFRRNADVIPQVKELLNAAGY